MGQPLRVHLDMQLWKSAHMRVDQPAWTIAAARHAESSASLTTSFGQDWEGLAEGLADAEILVCQSKPPTDIIAAAPKLKWIMMTMAGVEGLLPLDWLPEGILLTNNSGTHYPKTREFAAMALGMLHFKIPHLASAQRDHAWAPKLESLIDGRTVVVVGFGTLGQATAEAAQSMGLKVRAVRRNPAPHDLADEVFAPDQLAKACEGADFLICTLPSTPATANMVDGVAMDALKDGAGVVNIGRSPVMDYQALSERLDSGKLSGAILDVFDKEPLPADDPLWDQKGMMIMPHMSSDDPGNYIQRTFDVFFQNLEAYRAGKPLPTLIDQKHGY